MLPETKEVWHATRQRRVILASTFLPSTILLNFSLPGDMAHAGIYAAGTEQVVHVQEPTRGKDMRVH